MINKISVVGDSSTDHFLVLDEQDARLNSSSNNEKSLCLDYGQKTALKEQQTYFGGSALNVSVAFSLLGIEAHLSTIVGSDHSGKEMISFLSSKNVITDLVEVEKRTNNSYVIVYESERTVLSYHEKRNYNKLKVAKSEIIYLSSAGQGSEVLVDKITSLLAQGSKLVFNPGSYEISSFDLFRPLLDKTTLLILNRDEASTLFGESHKVTDQLANMLSSGTKVAVITDAQNGAYFGTQIGNFHMNAASGKLVDPTGAGDAFAAGLTAGLMHGKSLEESAIWRMHNASAVIEHIGANTNLLAIDQVDKIIKQNKILKFSRL